MARAQARSRSRRAKAAQAEAEVMEEEEFELDDEDLEDEDEEEEVVAAAPAKPKRGRGRPKGSAGKRGRPKGSTAAAKPLRIGVMDTIVENEEEVEIIRLLDHDVCTKYAEVRAWLADNADMFNADDRLIVFKTFKEGSAAVKRSVRFTF